MTVFSSDCSHTPSACLSGTRGWHVRGVERRERGESAISRAEQAIGKNEAKKLGKDWPSTATAWLSFFHDSDDPWHKHSQRMHKRTVKGYTRVCLWDTRETASSEHEKVSERVN